MGLSTLFFKKKNKEKPEVQPKNKNTSDCKLYQNIAYATSKLYRTRIKVKKKKNYWQKQNIQLKALTFQKKKMITSKSLNRRYSVSSSNNGSQFIEQN